MGPFQLYTPLAKVAPHKREVTGILTQEMPDHDGEVMDYASSKPYFQAWSTMVHQDTQGKSKGNLRVMHQPQVAGKITDIHYDDTAKAIHVTAKVSDNEQWKKVLNGEYTGFSVGGHYVDKWEDDQVLSSGKKAVRFTADPYEASLVDRPSVSSALFSSVKMIKMVTSDGHEEDVPLTELAAKAAGTESQHDELDNLLDALAKRVARRKDVDPKEGERQYGDVEYADPTNKKYPIDTEEHIRAAWTYINQSKDADKYSPAEVSEIKSKIIAAWKRKIDAKGPPSARGRKFVNPVMAKGLMRAGCLVQCIEELASFVQGQVYEDKVEQQMDGSKPSKLPKQVLASIKDLVPIMQQYIAEESEELLTQVAAATSSEAQKMSTSSGSTGDQSLSRFEAVTKGVNDLVALLKAASASDEAARKAAEDAEKAKRKAKEEGDEDEDEKEAGISDDEVKARKERNMKRKEKREAAAKAEQPKPAQSSNAGTKAADDSEGLVKAISELTGAVKETMEKTSQEMDVLKGVILMQAQEIQNLQTRVARKSAPLVPVSGDRFSDAYLARMGKSASGEGGFSDALKGIYAQARGE